MKVSGYPIYEDDSYAIFGNWLFRFTNGRFGSLIVFVKSSHIVFSVSAYEKAYLKAVIGHLAVLGLNPDSSGVTSQMVRDFIDAICSRGGWVWQSYFAIESPDKKAQHLLDRQQS